MNHMAEGAREFGKGVLFRKTRNRLDSYPCKDLKQ